jgi:hypothetical protein
VSDPFTVAARALNSARAGRPEAHAPAGRPSGVEPTVGPGGRPRSVNTLTPVDLTALLGEPDHQPPL